MMTYLGLTQISGVISESTGWGRSGEAIFVEELFQLDQLFFRETGSNPRNGFEPIFLRIVYGRENRPDSELRPVALAGKIADDDEIDRVGELSFITPLQLDPIEIPRTGRVRSIEPFGNNPFQPRSIDASKNF
ncbi:MAG: hypothetical protein MPW15_21760 [Candidatus Manganitrophus sp.]|nr:hypothetical protein [Candidatus Manganitrophus sp.]